MAVVTNVGDSLLVIRGPWRGRIGRIVNVHNLVCGLVDYEMKFEDGDDNICVATIPADDCREYCPGSINLESPFDITNYLSTSTMKSVATEIFRAKVTTYVDDILRNRVNAGCGNIVQQVLKEVTKTYAKKLSDKYDEDFIRVFKKVINTDVPESDEDKSCFAQGIQWSLENVATDYIKNHPDEMYDIMKDRIYEVAKGLVDDKLSFSISYLIKTQVDNMLKDIFDNIKSSKSNQV